MKTLNQALVSMVYSLTALMMLIGCGKKSASPTVNLQFSNNTASVLAQEMQAIGPRGLMRGLELHSSSLLGQTPLIYQMKFVTIYLVEAIADDWGNKGDATRIWTSSKCDSDLTHCGIGPDAAPYIVDYFDFAEGSAAVNKRLAAYERNDKNATLNPGTYNFIRMDFTGKVIEGVNDEVPNLKFGMSEAHEVRSQVQAVLVPLPKPLVLGAGETFTVDLAYDLENRFYESGNIRQRPAEVPLSATWTCDGIAEGVPCVVEPEFAPTVTKQ